jgi:hypothetical protein
VSRHKADVIDCQPLAAFERRSEIKRTFDLASFFSLMQPKPFGVVEEMVGATGRVGGAIPKTATAVTQVHEDQRRAAIGGAKFRAR